MASPIKGLEASEQVIEITFGANGKPTATPDFDISKCKNQMVRWVCNIPSASFTVDFGDKSPFYESHFNNANPLSGLVNRELRVPAGGKTFQYTVTLNGAASDPQGQVDP
jgi:hypothetical protein